MYRYRYNDQGFEVRALNKDGFVVRVTHNISRESVKFTCIDNNSRKVWVIAGNSFINNTFDEAVDNACKYILGQQKKRWADEKEKKERNNNMTTNLFRYKDENFSLSFEGHTTINITDMSGKSTYINYSPTFDNWSYPTTTVGSYQRALEGACEFLIQQRQGRAKDSHKEQVKEYMISLINQL